MKNYLFALSLIIISMLSCNVDAAIYRVTDSKGVVTYSDQPTTTGESIVLPQASISTAPTPPPTTETTDSKKNNTDTNQNPLEKKRYTTFEMKTPADQETFQNAVEIPLAVTIEPALQKGDTIQFFLDGQSVNKPSSSTTAVVSKTKDDKPVLERGSHTFYAVLYDEKHKQIKTTPEVTVFMHYASVLFPNQPAPPTPPRTQTAP